MNRISKLSFGAVSALLTLLVVSSTVLAAGGVGLWPSAGHDLQNTRNQNTESKISPTRVGGLALKWQFTTGGDVSATPAVDGNTVYFPDWAGNLYALNANTGAVVWQHKISDYTGVPGDVVRATPAISGNSLIFGDQGGNDSVSGARVMAVSKQTGALLWVTKVDDHPMAIVTQSAVVVGDGTSNIAIVGVASSEELYAAFIPGYTCCNFRGSEMALNASTGQILWKTYTVPVGYSGGAVWGSTAAVDQGRGIVYTATGNNYSVPQSVIDCVTAAGNDPNAVQACMSPENYFDSILALDLYTGATKWATHAMPYDAWNVSCIPGFGSNLDNCPSPTGPDYDFGQGPALFSVRMAGSSKPRAMLGIGQKSGLYWALDPATGAVLWKTQAGPGGTAGGLQWGSATDGTRIYVADANSNSKPWTLPDGSTTTAGVWSALNPATGQILWQRADPKGYSLPAPLSTANRVLFGCSLDPTGQMYALDPATGATLWQFTSGGSCNAGAAIVNGMVYWGSGYGRFGFGTPNNKFFAFGLP
jgi:polyvinyl alcohol dehydrogenase (cytochrome)